MRDTDFEKEHQVEFEAARGKAIQFINGENIPQVVRAEMLLLDGSVTSDTLLDLVVGFAVYYKHQKA